MNIFKTADILLPKDTDMTKWSVVACDQYTSQPEYWEETKKITKDFKTTLNLIFPEVYLSEGEERIKKINQSMAKYIEEGVFEEHKDSLFYIERTIPTGIRQGLIGQVDLEAYDFNKGAKSAIRATEGTVIERIPPRVLIRRDAPLELPHIMLLVNDEEKTLIEPLKDAKKELLYDFELMQNGGNLKGYKLSEKAKENVLAALDKLYEKADDGLLFAVGDGNHSLATAKTIWEEKKKTLTEEERENHPARYCLVEIVNIHCDALLFEPIHRVVFGVDTKEVLRKLEKTCGGKGHKVHYITCDEEGELELSNENAKLAVGALQKFIDEQGIEVDYIHGEDVTKELGNKDNNIGFLLPKPDKNDLFASVIKDGALPRKTFSMGEANEKRYYMEAKKIK